MVLAFVIYLIKYRRPTRIFYISVRLQLPPCWVSNLDSYPVGIPPAGFLIWKRVRSTLPPVQRLPDILYLVFLYINVSLPVSSLLFFYSVSCLASYTGCIVSCPSFRWCRCLSSAQATLVSWRSTCFSAPDGRR